MPCHSSRSPRTTSRMRGTGSAGRAAQSSTHTRAQSRSLNDLQQDGETPGFNRSVDRGHPSTAGRILRAPDPSNYTSCPLYYRDLQPLAQNMAQSSIVEYEIGLLVAQALDKVGDLVCLSTQRVDMHAGISRDSPQSLDMVVLQSALQQALLDAFESHSRTPDVHPFPPSRTFDSLPNRSADSGSSSHLPTSRRLTSHQLQELGATFGRDPSNLGEVVGRMWHSGDRRPDLETVVTRSSSLLVM